MLYYASIRHQKPSLTATGFQLLTVLYDNPTMVPFLCQSIGAVPWAARHSHHISGDGTESLLQRRPLLSPSESAAGAPFKLGSSERNAGLSYTKRRPLARGGVLDVRSPDVAWQLLRCPGECPSSL